MPSNATAIAQTVTPVEVGYARRRLEETTAGLLAATNELSDAQWQFQPAGGGWSIAGVVEHIVVVQEIVLGPVRSQLAAAPPAPVSERGAVDDAAIRLIPDRSARFQAPDFVQPTGRWTPAESLERLSANCHRFIEWLEYAPDLRLHAIESPPLKAVTRGAYTLMDGYQWVLTAAGHTERHTRQILEVKASSGFPER